MRRWKALLVSFIGLQLAIGSVVFSGRNGTESVVFAKGGGIYYESPIKGIIRSDCGRCHSGPTRNLMDYDSLKAYAEGGLLETMVQGPMRRFAGNDADTIIDWISAGAPEKPGRGAQVRFSQKATGNPLPCPIPEAGGVTDQPGTAITYAGTIKGVLKEDCLRCHSGPFRNLTTYENVKMYADNGLLKTLVMPGGPMHRFAGPDTRLFIGWIDRGAPR